MYLMMLLATFISAIYGYNLSARADYDREITLRKASAVVYRFLWHEKAATQIANKIKSQKIINENTIHNNGSNANQILPGDIFYASTTGNGGSTKRLIFRYNKEGKVGGGDVAYTFPINNEAKNNGSFNAKPAYILGHGRPLYDGSEMVTKVICLGSETPELDASGNPVVDSDGNPVYKEATLNTVGPNENCVSATTADNYLTGNSCCLTAKHTYLISYKKLDARWINRINKGISGDFVNAIIPRRYTDNIGVIKWDNSSNRWKFNGKMNFEPAYEEREKEWIEQHPGYERQVPDYIRKNTTWTLPRFFNSDYFKNAAGDNICQNGCLMRIHGF